MGDIAKTNKLVLKTFLEEHQQGIYIQSRNTGDKTIGRISQHN